MVQMIIGKKGKGKTKQLLDKVNSSIKTVNGNIVYIDKSSKHMLELNNKIRLIDASGYGLKNSDEFIGFILGIISQDHDLEEMYLDSFLNVAKLEGADITATIKELAMISENFTGPALFSVFPWIRQKYRQTLLNISSLNFNNQKISKRPSDDFIIYYVGNEPKSVLARDLGDCRDNLRNSRSVFLIVCLVRQKQISENIASSKDAMFFYRQRSQSPCLCDALAFLFIHVFYTSEENSIQYKPLIPTRA